MLPHEEDLNRALKETNYNIYLCIKDLLSLYTVHAALNKRHEKEFKYSLDLEKAMMETMRNYWPPPWNAFNDTK